MTDLEKLKSTFDELGIEYDHGQTYREVDPDYDAICLGKRIGIRCDGYGRSFACFLFEKKTGKLISYGVWE